MEEPILIESNVKDFLFDTLKKCHSNRVNLYYYTLNALVFFIFVGIVGVTLYYCSKQKLTDYELKQKMLHDQKYILSKIRFYQETKKDAEQSQMSGITNLPYTTQ
jgi:hypothetical protein